MRHLVPHITCFENLRLCSPVHANTTNLRFQKFPLWRAFSRTLFSEVKISVFRHLGVDGRQNTKSLCCQWDENELTWTRPFGFSVNKPRGCFAPPRNHRKLLFPWKWYLFRKYPNLIAWYIYAAFWLIKSSLNGAEPRRPWKSFKPGSPIVYTKTYASSNGSKSSVAFQWTRIEFVTTWRAT